MYTLVRTPQGNFALKIDGKVIAEFYCRITADLVCNLLNVTQVHAARSHTRQAG